MIKYHQYSSNKRILKTWTIVAGNGYIPVSSLKEILKELDPKLTGDEIDGIIEEIDEDGSGTVDFDGNTSYVSSRFIVK